MKLSNYLWKNKHKISTRCPNSLFPWQYEFIVKFRELQAYVNIELGWCLSIIQGKMKRRLSISLTANMYYALTKTIKFEVWVLLDYLLMQTCILTFQVKYLHKIAKYWVQFLWKVSHNNTSKTGEIELEFIRKSEPESLNSKRWISWGSSMALVYFSNKRMNTWLVSCRPSFTNRRLPFTNEQTHYW